MTPHKSAAQRRAYQRKLYYKKTEGKVKRRAELVPVTTEFIDKIINLGFKRGFKRETDIGKAIGLRPSFLSDCAYRINCYGKFSIQKPHYELIEDWIKNGKEAS